MSLIKDSTLQDIVEQIGRKNAVLLKFINDYDPTNLSWLTVQANVRAGKSKAKYAIGDELICNYTDINGNVYEFPWVVMDNDRECEWEDGTVHPGLWLKSKYATLESVVYNMAEMWDVPDSETVAVDGAYYYGLTGNTRTALNLNAGDPIPFGSYDRIQWSHFTDSILWQYGWNAWKYSDARLWLNSSDPIYEWWTEQYAADRPSSSKNTINGFCYGLDSDFLSVVTPVKINTYNNTYNVTDTTVDKFFLPSIEEVYGVPQKPGIEGNYFPYYKQITGWDAPSNDPSVGRKHYIVNAHSSASNVPTRSVYLGRTRCVWVIESTGRIDYGDQMAAYTSFRYSPVCVIS